MTQDTKVNGMAIMQKTPYGWKVKSFYASDFLKLRKRIEVRRGELILCGDFVNKPKCGYSKKPQVLLGISR
jgi:hypothetical protein